MLITFLCICPLEKWLFRLKAFIVSGRGESCLGCFKTTAEIGYMQCVNHLYLFWFITDGMITWWICFLPWFFYFVTNGDNCCFHTPACPVLDFQGRSFHGFAPQLWSCFFSLSCLYWLFWQWGIGCQVTHIPANALDRAHFWISYKRVQCSSLISQSYWNQIIK